MTFIKSLIDFLAGLVLIISKIFIRPDKEIQQEDLKRINDAVKQAKKGDTEALEDIINE